MRPDTDFARRARLSRISHLLGILASMPETQKRLATRRAIFCLIEAAPFDVVVFSVAFFDPKHMQFEEKEWMKYCLLMSSLIMSCRQGRQEVPEPLGMLPICPELRGVEEA